MKVLKFKTGETIPSGAKYLTSNCEWIQSTRKVMDPEAPIEYDGHHPTKTVFTKETVTDWHFYAVYEHGDL